MANCVLGLGEVNEQPQKEDLKLFRSNISELACVIRFSHLDETSDGLVLGRGHHLAR